MSGGGGSSGVRTPADTQVGCEKAAAEARVTGQEQLAGVADAGMRVTRGREARHVPGDHGRDKSGSRAPRQGIGSSDAELEGRSQAVCNTEPP